jgi:hypothetical protein
MAFCTACAMHRNVGDCVVARVCNPKSGRGFDSRHGDGRRRHGIPRSVTRRITCDAAATDGTANKTSPGEISGARSLRRGHRPAAGSASTSPSVGQSANLNRCPEPLGRGHVPRGRQTPPNLPGSPACPTCGYDPGKTSFPILLSAAVPSNSVCCTRFLSRNSKLAGRENQFTVGWTGARTLEPVPLHRLAQRFLNLFGVSAEPFGGPPPPPMG